MNKTHILLLALLLLSLVVKAQDCGTSVSDANLKHLNDLDEAWHLHTLSAQKAPPTSIQFVPVQLHIIRQTGGTGGIDPNEFLAAFERVNEHYAYSGIHFYQCAPIHYIDDNTYYNYDKTEMAALDAAHSVSNVINIYSTETVTSGASTICGHAQFPGGLDFVMLKNSCTLNGSTFEHELGHYFGLYHTHETAFGSELVNGSNCSTRGDRLCDTPADPRLTGNVDNDGCIYTGTGTDANGDSYSPSVANIMSYSSKECRVHFSDDQLDRMNFVLNNSRTYLSCGSPPILDAEFYAWPDDHCNNNLNVQFADVSDGTPNLWSWDFGDGIGTSTAQHPTYTYPNPGAYTVTLTATESGIPDVETKTAFIAVGAVTPPYSNGFEAGATDLGRFKEHVMYKNHLFVDPMAANTGSQGLVFDGFDGSVSPSFQTPTSAVCFDSLWNPFYRASCYLCVDATRMQDMTLSFDLYQVYRYNNNYTNFRITVDGTAISPVYQPGGTTGPWETKTINLDAYVGNVITIGFEGTHKYSEDYSGGGNVSFVDNINITGNVILPVDWTRFDAVAVQDGVNLDWEVASTDGILGFEVERSVDQENWDRINRQATVGSGKTFGARDLEPVEGTAYYRLQALTLDGEKLTSEIEIVNWQRGIVAVYPNPVSREQEWLHISMPATGSFPLNEVTLLDLRGQVIEVDFRQANEEMQMNVKSIAAGVYLLRIRHGEEVQMHRVVIQP